MTKFCPCGKIARCVLSQATAKQTKKVTCRIDHNKKDTFRQTLQLPVFSADRLMDCFSVLIFLFPLLFVFLGYFFSVRNSCYFCICHEIWLAFGAPHKFFVTYLSRRRKLDGESGGEERRGSYIGIFIYVFIVARFLWHTNSVKYVLPRWTFGLFEIHLGLPVWAVKLPNNAECPPNPPPLTSLQPQTGFSEQWLASDQTFGPGR